MINSVYILKLRKGLVKRKEQINSIPGSRCCNNFNQCVKNILFIFLIISPFIYGSGKSSKENINANDNSKISILNIDIKSLVQAQIDSAKERAKRGEIKSYCSIFIPVSEKTSEHKINKEIKSSSRPGLFSELLHQQLTIKILIILGFSVAVFLFVFIRRMTQKDWNSIFQKLVIKKEKNKNDSAKKELKENIISIREEASIKRENPALNLIRSELVKKAAPEILTNSISSKAKELKIAQGELILAAKIKSFQLAQFGSHNK
jgi:hypothetical protein